MPRIQTVTVAGQEYELKEQPGRQAIKWRQEWGLKLSERYLALKAQPADTPEDKIKLLALTDEWSAFVVESALAYSPELAQDREKIEAGYFESEIVALNNAIQELASPFA